MKISSDAIRRIAADKEEGGDVKVVSDKQEWYFGMDGDNMGHTVEDALIENDIARSQEFEKQIKGAFAEIEEWIASIGGAVVFNGGDNVLFTATGDPHEIAEKARGIYQEHTDHSATVGVGHKPVESHKALVIGKNTGKDQVVIWDDEKEAVYADIKKQQEALEACEEDIREDSDFDLASSPGLKYQADAKRHYDRLRGIGYEHAQADAFINNLYRGASYRDVLHERRKQHLTGSTPAERYLRDGEERYQRFTQNGFTQESSEKTVEIPATPTVGQKIVTEKDLGRIAFVGSRFITIEWLRSEKKERIALSRYHELVRTECAAPLPVVRTAQRATTAVREG